MDGKHQHRLDNEGLPIIPKESPHGYVQLVCPTCGFSHKVPVRCKDKTCSFCSWRRSARIRSRILQAVEKMPNAEEYRWYHLVLTQRPIFDLKQGIRTIVRDFRWLRSQHHWKNHIRGGFYTVESKEKPYGWHVHIHAVVYGKFPTYALLSRKWEHRHGYKGLLYFRQLTGSQSIKTCIHYVVKYSIKAGIEVSDEKRDYYNLAVRSARLFNTFGEFHKILLQYTSVKSVFPCPKCGGTQWLRMDTLADLSRRSGIRHTFCRPP